MKGLTEKLERLGSRVFLALSKEPSSKRECYWAFVLPWFGLGVLLGGAFLAFGDIFLNGLEGLSRAGIAFFAVLVIATLAFFSWLMVILGRKDRDDGYWDVLHEQQKKNWERRAAEAKAKLGR